MATCAFAAITDNTNKILLMQIAPPFRQAHSWNFPGGVVEPGETTEAGLLREVIEETGTICRITGLLDNFQTLEPDNDIYIYRGTYVSGTVAHQEEEAEAAGWFTFEEALALPLAFNIRGYVASIKPSIVRHSYV